MDVVFGLVGISVVLLIVIAAVLTWAVRDGQFEDLEGPAWRVIMDDDRPPEAGQQAPARRDGDTRMQNVLERLHDDHAHFNDLLDILAAQLDQVEAAKNEDFDVMRDVMLYITRYSDQVHHPTEDLVYARLAEKSPRDRDALAQVPPQHEQLIAAGTALFETLREIADGEMVLRERILTQGRAYVEDLRKHMILEERHLFPAAEKVLDDQDLQEVARILDEQRDPIFGPVVEDDFRDLYAYIQDQRRA